MKPRRLVLIAGAGPAGLTCAYELLRRTDCLPLVVEAEAQVGGLARTVVHRGNRMDIGGHRFFSKSDRVLRWWAEMLPFDAPEGSSEISYQSGRRGLPACGLPRAEPGAAQAFVLRPRVSRILYGRKFFDYPVSLSLRTLRQLGAGRLAAILASYLRARLPPRRQPRNLEEFFIARFGRRLYETFFKSYTEKVWGRPCSEIGAEWGSQRVKTLSAASALENAVRRLFGRGLPESSFIERFLYPRRGPGQLWEEAARRIMELGGEIRLRCRVSGVRYDGERIVGAEVEDLQTGRSSFVPCDAFVSTMPVKELFASMEGPVPEPARRAAEALEYRDFVTVGLLVDKLEVRGADGGLIPDNWIYVQEPDVRLGRIQVYNNWGRDMVADPSKVWLGLEYFCSEGDALWSKPDGEMIAFAREELCRIGFIAPGSMLDAKVLRVPKAYPAYWGGFELFGAVRGFVDSVPNLYLVGRNGMHRYNNQDHSMLAAMAAVDHLAGACAEKAAAWAVNADDGYHEASGAPAQDHAAPQGEPARQQPDREAVELVEQG